MVRISVFYDTLRGGFMLCEIWGRQERENENSIGETKGKKIAVVY